MNIDGAPLYQALNKNKRRWRAEVACRRWFIGFAIGAAMVVVMLATQCSARKERDYEIPSTTQ